MALVSSNCQFNRKANKILADHLSEVFAVVFVLSVCGLVSGLKWFAKWQARGGEGYCDVVIIGWIARHRGLNGKYRCCQLWRWVMSRAGNEMNVRSVELGWDISNCNFEFDSSLSLLWWYRIVVCAQDIFLNLFWIPQIKRFKQPSNQQQQQQYDYVDDCWNGRVKMSRIMWHSVTSCVTHSVTSTGGSGQKWLQLETIGSSPQSGRGDRKLGWQRYHYHCHGRGKTTRMAKVGLRIDTSE